MIRASSFRAGRRLRFDPPALVAQGGDFGAYGLQTSCFALLFGLEALRALTVSGHREVELRMLVRQRPQRPVHLGDPAVERCLFASCRGCPGEGGPGIREPGLQAVLSGLQALNLRLQAGKHALLGCNAGSGPDTVRIQAFDLAADSIQPGFFLLRFRPRPSRLT